MKERGRYAKGVAKRQEILEKTLELVGRRGVRAASVKEIAAAVHLSEAGLLHYFGTKNDLFVAILEARDEVDRSRTDPADLGAAPGAEGDASRLEYYADRPLIGLERVGEITRRNSEVPGLVELFARMQVEAADPDHPAHRYFLDRNSQIRDVMAKGLAASRDLGLLAPEADVERVARALEALLDGLQLQSLLEPDLDIAAIVNEVLVLVGAAERGNT